MKRIIIIWTLGLFILPVATGQNTMNYAPVNMYMMNTLLINPGYAGAKESFSFSAMYGKSWVDMPGAGNLQAVTGHTPMRNNKIALGFMGMKTTFGVNSSWKGYFYYSYRINIGKGKLGLGIRGGLNQFKTELTKAEFRQPGDPAQVDENRIFPNFGVGAYWYTDNYYLGLSVPDLVFPPTGSGSFDASPVNYNYTFTGGVLFRYSDNFKIKPSTLITYTLNSPLVYQANLSLIFLQDMIWLGASYKPNGMVAIAEFQITKQIRLGYAYEFPLGDLTGYTSGSHEILLRYDFSYKMRAVSPTYFW